MLKPEALAEKAARHQNEILHVFRELRPGMTDARLVSFNGQPHVWAEDQSGQRREWTIDDLGPVSTRGWRFRESPSAPSEIGGTFADGIEAAARLVCPEPFVPEERSCVDVAAAIRALGPTVAESSASALGSVVAVALDAGWTGEGTEELAEWLRERIAEAALARTRATDGTQKDPDLVWAPSAEDLTRAATTGGALLPCPFCGSWPLSTREVNRRTGNVVIRISCPGKRLTPCSFMVSCHKPENEQEGRADIYARWNARASICLPCPSCHGEGEVCTPTGVPGDEGWSPCPVCQGTEVMPAWQEIGNLRRETWRLAGDLQAAEGQLEMWKEQFGAGALQLSGDDLGTAQISAAQRLCEIYFDIAESALGAEEVRRRRDSQLGQPLAPPLAPNAAQLATACDAMAAAIRRAGGVSPAIADEFEALMRAFDAMDEEEGGVPAQPAPWTDQEREAMAGGEPGTADEATGGERRQ